ncbi:hypothetical protein [Azospirillum argentinense]|uniref:DUF2460 domain-containing protein n=1 Tax=Azospirillum argentinense TaxID=2970906 RepID=UPI0032DF8359
MMADDLLLGYIDAEFPPGIAKGATGGPVFGTDVLAGANGREQRIVRVDQPLQTWDVAHGLKTQAEFEELSHFFYDMRGRGYAFKFKNWLDHRLNWEVVGEGGGDIRTFSVTKTYGRLNPVVRRIRRLKPGTVSVAIDGVPLASGLFSADHRYGRVTLAEAPRPGQLVQVHAEFWLVCRFDTDQMLAQLENYNIASWAQIPVKEVEMDFEDDAA